MRCSRSTDSPRRSLRTRSRVFSLAEREPRTRLETNDQVLIFGHSSTFHELMQDHCYSVYNMAFPINRQADASDLSDTVCVL
jgi:hypothetical protein